MKCESCNQEITLETSVPNLDIFWNRIADTRVCSDRESCYQAWKKELLK